MTTNNAAAERLRAELGVAYRIDLLDQALAAERTAAMDECAKHVEAALAASALFTVAERRAGAAEERERIRAAGKRIMVKDGPALTDSEFIAILDEEAKR